MKRDKHGVPEQDHHVGTFHRRAPAEGQRSPERLEKADKVRQHTADLPDDEIDGRNLGRR